VSTAKKITQHRRTGQQKYSQLTVIKKKVDKIQLSEALQTFESNTISGPA